MKNIAFAVAATLFMAGAVTEAYAEDLLIGTLLPLTGPGSATGTEQQNGINLAIKHINAKGGINGMMLKAVVEDSTGRPDQAVLGFNRLTDLNNVKVVMSAYSSVTLAVDPLAARKEVLLVNAGAQSDQLATAGPYLINTIPQIQGEAEFLAEFAKQKLGTSAALLYENAAAGRSGRDDFAKAFEALGGKIVADEPTEFGQTNYRPSLLAIKASGAQVLYIAVTQNFAAIAEQISLIPDFPSVVGNTFSTPFFGKPGAEGWYNTTVVSKIPPALAEEFKAEYNVDFFEVQSREYYNSVFIIADAMKKVLDDGKEVNGTNLRDAILAIGTFKSEIADITFDGSNTAKRPIAIEQNGKNERIVIDFSP